MQVQVTGLQFLIGQAAVFPPKQNGNLLPPPARFEGALRTVARVLHWPGYAAPPRTGTNNKLAVGNGLIQAVHKPRPLQQILCGSRSPVGLLSGKLRRLYQAEIRQAHVLHRPCHSAYIARVAGIDQYDSD